MKTTSIEIPASILSALAANPGDTRLAASVCSAIVEAAGILGGTPVIPDTGAEADPSVITQLAFKKRERRKAAAEKRRTQPRTARTQPHPISEQRHTQRLPVRTKRHGVHHQKRIPNNRRNDHRQTPEGPSGGKHNQAPNTTARKGTGKKQGLSTGNRPHPISSMP